MALSFRENIFIERRLPRDQQLLSGRAELLSPGDRELVEAVLIRGQTFVSVSRMMGISPRKAGNRVRRLAALLASRQFLETARALRYLPREDARLARLRFCAGLSERKLAGKLQVSTHAIRRRLDRIRAQIAIVSRLDQERRRHPHALSPQDVDWLKEALHEMAGA